MQFYQPLQGDTQRQPLEPHKIVSGILPGATQIRIGGDSNVLIDGLNRRITITQADGSSVGIGIIPSTGELGSFTLDTSGNLVSKVVGGIYYFYDTGGHLLQKISAGASYVYDTSSNLIEKTDSGTTYIYDISTNKNIMQIGKLPDGSYGMAVAKAGYNVSDGIS